MSPSRSASRFAHDERARERRKDGCVHPYEHSEPSGYIAWHKWAEKYAETHDQGQCSECGLWAIWTPKETP